MTTNPMTCWLTHKRQPPRPARVPRDVRCAGPQPRARRRLLPGPENYASAVALPYEPREPPAGCPPCRPGGSGPQTALRELRPAGHVSRASGAPPGPPCVLMPDGPVLTVHGRRLTGPSRGLTGTAHVPLSGGPRARQPARPRHRTASPAPLHAFDPAPDTVGTGPCPREDAGVIRPLVEVGSSSVASRSFHSAVIPTKPRGEPQVASASERPAGPATLADGRSLTAPPPPPPRNRQRIGLCLPLFSPTHTHGHETTVTLALTSTSTLILIPEAFADTSFLLFAHRRP